MAVWSQNMPLSASSMEYSIKSRANPVRARACVLALRPRTHRVNSPRSGAEPPTSLRGRAPPTRVLPKQCQRASGCLPLQRVREAVHGFAPNVRPTARTERLVSAVFVNGL
ncbi:hypothetical protein BC628DRAFT_509656 [Trametes gibbosa]|nr:hypothetical protein BC628DRAFT_509656 [Trametes gibbosa]